MELSDLQQTSASDPWLGSRSMIFSKPMGNHTYNAKCYFGKVVEPHNEMCCSSLSKLLIVLYELRAELYLSNFFFLAILSNGVDQIPLFGWLSTLPETNRSTMKALKLCVLK